MFLRPPPFFFLIKVPKMSGRGDGGQQQLLHSKFLAGFVCHIEKNEVETNADTFCLHGVFLFLFLSSHFFPHVFYFTTLFLFFVLGGGIRENEIHGILV